MFAATEIRCVSPVKTFYRAQQADPILYVQALQDAVEPTSFTTLQDGYFGIYNNGASQAVTVLYRLGGTATNGVDYTNLTGTVLLPAGGFAACTSTRSGTAILISTRR